MSRVLVIPDIHLKPWMLVGAKGIDRSTYDTAVLLGDLADDWDQGRNTDLYKETLEETGRFLLENTDALFCIGNHDYSSLHFLPETGYSNHAQEIVSDWLIKMSESIGDRLAVIHRIDRCLFSHAGLTFGFCHRICADTSEDTDIDDIIRRINGLIFNSDTSLLWDDESPIWARPQDGTCVMFPEGSYQIMGHTPVTAPFEIGRTLTLDTFSTYPDGSPIGDERFVIVDTETQSWHYAL